MRVVPASIEAASAFVDAFHRHNIHTPFARFALALDVRGEVKGVAIVGTPVARPYNESHTAEVLRVCTLEDAPLGAVSCLYAACRRVWFAMGGRRLVTYTLQSESGASLRGAGWTCTATLGARSPDEWGKYRADGITRRSHAVVAEPKLRWETVNERANATLPEWPAIQPKDNEQMSLFSALAGEGECGER